MIIKEREVYDSLYRPIEMSYTRYVHKRFASDLQQQLTINHINHQTIQKGKLLTYELKFKC